ncbi:MAG TPA: hypothetical protein VK468_07860 [Pyrinomonadaceae bacterium]|nr:hypothetical protein [Pyrinomonadaceae bacterium]
MTEKGKIKVIKKDDIKVVKTPVAKEARSKRVAAREMVSNVSTWVNEFQVRKRDETKVAIEKFFSTPQPSEL